MDNAGGGRSKFCCPCCLGLYIPNCKGGFAGIGFCIPPTITTTDEGFDGAFFGIFAKADGPAEVKGAPSSTEMAR